MNIDYFKALAKKTPLLPGIYKYFRRRRLKKKTIEQRFNHIFKYNFVWGGHTSASGRGSDLDQAQTLILELPKLFKEFNISTLFDIPCGDFNWMQHVDLNGIQYTGADIVKAIIENNTKAYQTDSIVFQYKNLIQDTLPQVDLILVRDCLVHFSYEDIFKALRNILKSQSNYLLTTTYPDRGSNADIVTGEWRPLNLEIEPFSLPKPIKIINENCTEGNLAYTDKSLGLWKISDIKKLLK